jgi:hypothetical protein
LVRLILLSMALVSELRAVRSLNAFIRTVLAFSQVTAVSSSAGGSASSRIRTL